VLAIAMVISEYAERFADRATLLGLKVMAAPGADADADKATLPENELSEVSVTVRFAEEPLGIFKDEDEVERENPGVPRLTTVTETRAEWVKEPLVPVTLTENPPVRLEADNVRAEVAEPPADSWRLVALNDVERPLGETVSTRPTVPVKPPILVRVIVARPVPP
jgi:hypothetical protein